MFVYVNVCTSVLAFIWTELLWGGKIRNYNVYLLEKMRSLHRYRSGNDTFHYIPLCTFWCKPYDYIIVIHFYNEHLKNSIVPDFPTYSLRKLII